MTEEATVSGEGCSLVLRVFGYAYQAVQTGDDANWLRAEVELVASNTGTFRAKHGVYLRAEELARFRDQLTRLLDLLTGEVMMDHLEGHRGAPRPRPH